MTNEEFDKYKDALAVKLLEKPKGLMKQAMVYQSEIDTQEYNFNRAQIEVDALKTIVKDDIIQFYQVRAIYLFNLEYIDYFIFLSYFY